MSFRRLSAPIELWDSGRPVSAHAGETLAKACGGLQVPLWALDQINKNSENTALTEGQHIVIPRYLGAKTH